MNTSNAFPFTDLDIADWDLINLASHVPWKRHIHYDDDKTYRFTSVHVNILTISVFDRDMRWTTVVDGCFVSSDDPAFISYQ